MNKTKFLVNCKSITFVLYYTLFSLLRELLLFSYINFLKTALDIYNQCQTHNHGRMYEYTLHTNQTHKTKQMHI